ncbi:MAG: TolC family protein [Sedimentisphaerales bacterium]|nr:TolC family protein [Sedimentisphaerales bacterium]
MNYIKAIAKKSPFSIYIWPLISCFLYVSLFFSGCVPEKNNKKDSLVIYQEKLTNYKTRQGIDSEDPNQPLAILRPAASNEITLPEINIAIDPNTGKKVVELTLEEVIKRTLSNSPEIRVVSFDPSISNLDIIKATSEFDVTAFGDLNYENNDNPENSIYQSGQSNARTIDAGIKQKLITGAEWSLTYAFTRNWDDLAGRVYSSRYEPILSFQLRQPLLRNAWENLNLAGIDIARLNYLIAMLGFRQKAEDITTKAISYYWQLVQAKQNIEIYKSLLKQTEETLSKVQGRREIDASEVQIQQAQAYVKSRQAALIQAQKQVLDQQDAIIRLISDSKLNLLEEINITPVSQLSFENTELDINKLLETTIQKNPVIQQARIGIEIAKINIRIAQNQKMPRLDLVTSLRTQDIDNSPEDAFRHMNSTDYVSYGVGLSLEYPLGNRNRNAELMQRRFARRKADVNLENIMDQAAQLTKEVARRVETDYLEIEKQRAASEAARLHLKVLEESEIIRERLTPEFMLLKLQAQEFLANAQIAEIRAIADYNIAIAELSRITGTILELHLLVPTTVENSDTPEVITETDIINENSNTNTPSQDDLVPIEMN